MGSWFSIQSQTKTESMSSSCESCWLMLLPYDVLRYVLEVFIVDISDVVRLDSALCCSANRPLLLSSLRSVTVEVVRSHSAACSVERRSVIVQWCMRKGLTLNKHCEIGCFFDTDLTQIKAYATSCVSFCDHVFESDPTSRLTDVEWMDFLQHRVQVGSHLVVGTVSQKLNGSTTADVLVRMPADSFPVLSLNPRCALQKVCLPLYLQQLEHILQHCGPTISHLHIIIPEGGRTFPPQDHQHPIVCDVTSLPCLTELVFEVNCGGKKDQRATVAVPGAYEYLVQLFAAATELRVLWLGCSVITEFLVEGMLTHLIWRERSHVLRIRMVNDKFARIMCPPATKSAAWQTANPPITEWELSLESDIELSEFWSLLPMGQRVRSLTSDRFLNLFFLAPALRCTASSDAMIRNSLKALSRSQYLYLETLELYSILRMSSNRETVFWALAELETPHMEMKSLVMSLPEHYYSYVTLGQACSTAWCASISRCFPNLRSIMLHGVLFSLGNVEDIVASCPYLELFHVDMDPTVSTSPAGRHLVKQSGSFRSATCLKLVFTLVYHEWMTPASAGGVYESITSCVSMVVSRIVDIARMRTSSRNGQVIFKSHTEEFKLYTGRVVFGCRTLSEGTGEADMVARLCAPLKIVWRQNSEFAVRW